MSEALAITGIAITANHRIALQTQAGTYIIALDPNELRSFAGALLRQADAIEGEAAASASAAIARAGRLA